MASPEVQPAVHPAVPVISAPSFDPALAGVSEFKDRILPAVFPVHISADGQNASDEWKQRLSDEYHTVQSGVFLSEHPADSNAAQLGAPGLQPPWHRYKPCVQRAFRADGTRVRDGGGVGSPLIVDPAFQAADPGLRRWPDVLAKVRTVLQWVSAQSSVPPCVKACASVCSRISRSEDRGEPVEADLAQHADLQRQLQTAVSQAGVIALKKLQAVSTALLPDSQSPVSFAIAEGQPFRLRFLSALAYACGDVDAAFPLLPIHPSLWPFMLFRWSDYRVSNLLGNIFAFV